MRLGLLDQIIVIVYLAAIMGIGLAMKRRAAQGPSSYFLGGRDPEAALPLVIGSMLPAGLVGFRLAALLFLATFSSIVNGGAAYLVKDTAILEAALPLYIGFPAIALASTIITIGVAQATAPTDALVLREFYRRVQPAGLD